MVEELFSNVEATIIMYAPVVLVYITQFIDWFCTIKKVKALDLQKQISPVVNRLNKVIDQNDKICKINYEHTKKMDQAMVALEEAKRRYDETVENINAKLEEQNKILCELVQKNLELEAKAARVEE